ncbi:MAG TPA: RidA family protein [Thermoanaerobaculaceae bacterium]|nr:RidA family protein [Thermoanaerobaculaceae bacterium]
MTRNPRQRASSGSPYEPRIGFSRAVRVGRTIAVSGTAPIGPDGATVGPGDPAAQTRRCLEIIRAAVEQLGGSLDDVVRTRIFLVRVEDWPEVGRVHGEFFAAVRPAATMVKVAGLLDPEWLVEIEADAVVAASRRRPHT